VVEALRGPLACVGTAPPDEFLRVGERGALDDERAVERVEGLACRGLFCRGAESLCIEPDGLDPDAFAFVGEGKGLYKQVQNYNYVGEGSGSWEKVEKITPSSWRLKPACRCLLLSALVLVGGVVGWSSYSGSGATTSEPTQQSAMNPESGKGDDGEFSAADCSDADVVEWSDRQRTLCCDRFNKGCLKPVDAVDQEAKPPETYRPTSAPSTPPPDEGPIIRYDCKAGLSNWQWGWSMGKKDWCCTHENAGCPEQKAPATHAAESEDPYVCAEDYDRWQMKWTIGKRAWCCKHERLACPEGYTGEEQPVAPYDCAAGLADERSWSEGKKAWCCHNQHKGCEA